MVLQWIQDNARRFGGDPRRVMLFGQSSGSFDVQVLMASPLSNGLFHAAIAESGQMTSFAGNMVKGRAERIGEQIADALHAPRGIGALAMGRPGDTVAWSDADRKAVDVVQEYWTNFARIGNPNGGSLPEWPRYEPATAFYLEFSADGPVVRGNIRPTHCAIFLEWVRQVHEGPEVTGAVPRS